MIAKLPHVPYKLKVFCVVHPDTIQGLFLGEWPSLSQPVELTSLQIRPDTRMEESFADSPGAPAETLCLGCIKVGDTKNLAEFVMLNVYLAFMPSTKMHLSSFAVARMPFCRKPTCVVFRCGRKFQQCGLPHAPSLTCALPIPLPLLHIPTHTTCQTSWQRKPDLSSVTTKRTTAKIRLDHMADAAVYICPCLFAQTVRSDDVYLQINQ